MRWTTTSHGDTLHNLHSSTALVVMFKSAVPGRNAKQKAISLLHVKGVDHRDVFGLRWRMHLIKYLLWQCLCNLQMKRKLPKDSWA